ncbi:MAG: response regulator [Acidobacteriales bacterium]|nr:response regulator [Terriglobales bacterium]
MFTVLCIDDNPYILGIYEHILHSKGYKVITAANGADGLTLVREHSVDVVVLDFHMPGLDGAQVARVLASEHPRVPVLVCSSFPDDLPQSVYSCADAVLDKADDAETLLSLIQQLVQRTGFRVQRDGLRDHESPAS